MTENYLNTNYLGRQVRTAHYPPPPPKRSLLKHVSRAKYVARGSTQIRKTRNVLRTNNTKQSKSLISSMRYEPTRARGLQVLQTGFRERKSEQYQAKNDDAVHNKHKKGLTGISPRPQTASDAQTASGVQTASSVLIHG